MRFTGTSNQTRGGPSDNSQSQSTEQDKTRLWILTARERENLITKLIDKAEDCMKVTENK